MTLRRLLPLLALLAAVPAHAMERYLAVLELSGTADRFAREALSDRVRSVASEALRGRWLVTTRENVLERLRRSGQSCTAADSSCTVELGRAVGAELVLFGTANAPPGAPLEVELALQETGDGKRVGAVSARFPTALAALDGLGQAVMELLRQRSLVAPGPIDLYDPGLALEGRAGFVAPIFPHAGKLGFSPADTLGLVGSYRLREHWALETAFQWDDYSKQELMGGAIYHLGAGAEWTPTDFHGLALAGGLGAALLRRKLYDDTSSSTPPPSASEHETAPEAFLEYRIHWNIGLMQLGGRFGVRATWKRETLSAPSGNRRIEPGVQLDLPFWISVRVAL
jgi:hypothetical protein